MEGDRRTETEALDTLTERVDDLAQRVKHLEQTGAEMKTDVSEIKTAVAENTALTRRLGESATGAMLAAKANASALADTNTKLDGVAGGIDMIFALVKTTPFWTKVMQFVIAVGGTYAMIKGFGL